MNTRTAFPWITCAGLATTLLLSGCIQSTPAIQSTPTVVKSSSVINHSQQETNSLQHPTLKIATITPVVESMANALTANTSIKVVYLPSHRYSIKRIPGWLKKQDQHAFPKVDAIVGISSVWTELNAYPSFRLQNIQVVPIDLAHALIPGGERVVLSQDKDELSPRYFWLNPANALIMVGILSRDLTALINQMPYPAKIKEQMIDTLHQNQADVNQSLRAFQVSLDQTLMNKQIMQVTTDKPELNGLLAATLLPDVSLEEAKANDFPTLLITSRKTSHKGYRNLPAHITVWSIDDFGKVKDTSFIERWKYSLSNL